jgi:O-succinylbenzoic acid--CoA ligase
MKQRHLSIAFGSTTLKLDDLRRRDASSFPPFERVVVEFCQQWMRGQEHFEVTTSGSTGIPKKIRFRREQLEASARLTSEALGLTEGMTAMLCLDPQFIAGKMMIVRSLVTGMNLIALNAAANPLDHLPKEVPHIDFAAFVPLQVITALGSPRSPGFDRFGTVIIGGGQADADLRARLQGLRTSFYASFGMTETITHVALQKLNGENQTDNMHALRGIRFTTDERDCLVIHAPHIGDQPVVTNDIVEVVDQSTFRWRGRWDNVINTGGVKVSPEVVEPAVGTALARLHLHNRFFIWGNADELLGQEIVLVVEGTLDPETEVSVLSTLKEQLPKYSAPRKVFYADKFVFTSTGKIKRVESAAMASPRPD